MGDDSQRPDGSVTASMSPSEFSTFVISLGSSVLMSLGHDDQSGGASVAPDLDLARQSIAILVMLEEKTRGNLTEAEQQLLTGVIYQSRMSFIALTEQSSGEET